MQRAFSIPGRLLPRSSLSTPCLRPWAQPGCLFSSWAGCRSVSKTLRACRIAGEAAGLEKATRPLSTSATPFEKPELPPLVDHVLRGMGQVVFCNSAASGALITAGLFYGDPWLGTLAVTGCASATLAAGVAEAPAANIAAGLLGYNGALVGCAFSVFLAMSGWAPGPVLMATVAGGAASALVAMQIGRFMTVVPQWTLAFNITALSVLAYVQPFSDAAPPSEILATSAMAGADWISSMLVGVSQIFVVNNPIAGALVLAGIAAYSPAAAAATFVGSLIGVVAAVAVGADMAEVKDGLWGFNPALTALAVSIFFVPLGSAYAALAVGGAFATAILTIGMKAAVGGAIASPSLTLPFCAAASACFLAGGRAPGLVRAASPHSPEQNLRAFKA